VRVSDRCDEDDVRVVVVVVPPAGCVREVVFATTRDVDRVTVRDAVF
jgi:hypothetical protein